jgi:hypothetical protein
MRFLIPPALLFLILLATSPSAQAFEWVSPTSLNYDSPSTGTQTFKIDCGTFNSAWTVSAPEWIILDQWDGAGTITITVNVQNNESFDQSRSNEIYIRITLPSTVIQQWVTITQAATNTPDINLSTNTLNVMSNYDEKSNAGIDINSNYAWTATMDSWIELYLNNAQINSGTTGALSLQVRVYPNPSSDPRTGTITFSTGNTTKTLTVNQDGSVAFIKLYNWDGSSFIPFLSDTLKFNWDETTSTANPTGFSRLYITNNVNWTYSFSDESWLTDFKSSTAGYAVDYWDLNTRLESNLRITVSANETGNSRFSILTLSANGFTKKIVIAQSSKSILSLSNLSGTSTSGANDFTVYPNPSNGVIYFKHTNRVNITIYDINGSILNSFDTDEKNTLELNPGLYFIVAQEKNGVKTTQKLIIE